MHIAYCTNVRLPSERAHGHQIAQVCDALAKLGHTVTIFAPVRANTITENYHQYYKAEKGVSIEYVKGFDAPHFAKRFFSLGFLGLLISNATLRKNISVALKSRNFDAIYTRTPALMSSLLKTSVPIILELHQLPRWSRRIFVRHCNQCRTVVCLTSIMKETLRSWGIDEKKLTVEPDGVDLARFASMHITTAARAHFNLTTSRTVVGYVGRLKTLGMEKGVADLLRALSTLRETKKFFGLIVGGPESDVREYKELAASLHLTSEDVLFTGPIESNRVPIALAACDVVTMPFPSLPHYRTNMSPLKMFEYMAAGKPIITSDLPPIRDVLAEETAVFYPPNDISKLADAIQWSADHSTEVQARATRAQALVVRYDWTKRMERVLQAATNG